jgi:uncharacterized membrane protein
MALKSLGDEMLVSSIALWFCHELFQWRASVRQYGWCSVYRLGLSPVWAAHANDFRHSLQLVATGVSNAQYFGLIRNFRRQAFTVVSVLARVASCISFVNGHELQQLSDSDVHALRHVAAHGPAGLPERQASLAVF